jgi:hypothetical protein
VGRCFFLDHAARWKDEEAAAMTDERFTDQVFERYRIEHGIPESRRLGDMPMQVISKVMGDAQELKRKEQEAQCE